MALRSAANETTPGFGGPFAGAASFMSHTVVSAGTFAYFRIVSAKGLVPFRSGSPRLSAVCMPDLLRCTTALS